MPSDPPMNSTSDRSRRLLRIALIAVCLAAAFAAAILSRPPEQEEAAVAPATAAPNTAAEVIAAIAEPQGDSPTDESFYDPAELAYGRANQLDPQNVDALAGIAWVKGDRHLFDESIEWGKKALALDPDHAPTLGILGDAALELGNYDEAFEYYQKMMDSRPDLSSYSRGAYLLWVTGNRPKAAFLMEKAIRAGAPYAENTAWCRARLALMLFHQGAYLPAEQALAPALEKSSRNLHVLLAAGRIKAAQADVEAAREFYTRAVEVSPNIEALAALGDLAAANGDKDEAEKFYRQVEELHAAHKEKGAHDHMEMARFYADHDRNLIEALRIAEQRKLTRNVFEADTLAWVYYKNGQLEKAQEAISRALSQNTPDPAIQYHAGMIAARAGDRVTAQKHLSTALSWNPQFHPRDSLVAVQTLQELGGNAANVGDLAGSE
jgi:tetratricopeptide (TPR) repeat protein